MAMASLSPMTSTLCLIRFIRQVFRRAVRLPQVCASEGYYADTASPVDTAALRHVVQYDQKASSLKG